MLIQKNVETNYYNVLLISDTKNDLISVMFDFNPNGKLVIHITHKDAQCCDDNYKFFKSHNLFQGLTIERPINHLQLSFLKSNFFTVTINSKDRDHLINILRGITGLEQIEHLSLKNVLATFDIWVADMKVNKSSQQIEIEKQIDNRSIIAEINALMDTHKDNSEEKIMQNRPSSFVP